MQVTLLNVRDLGESMGAHGTDLERAGGVNKNIQNLLTNNLSVIVILTTPTGVSIFTI